jgi:hypothetical protein
MVRRIRLQGMIHMAEKRNVYRILVGKPEGKRPRYRQMDNIKNISQIGGLVWTGLIWFRNRLMALVSEVA